MSTPRHRALRRRSVLASILLAVLGSLVLTVAAPGGPPSATAASQVSKSLCSKFDPNLVHGVCLKYQAKSGAGYTWIGSYRATNGKVFFCIDYLYDSRIQGNAATVGTEPLQNQFGTHIGDAEVSALNYLISTWAPAGSTGNDTNDAAIALIIREVMSDAIRSDGTVVYKPGLKVGGTVAAPIGGLTGSLLGVAGSMWHQASLYRGPGRLVLASDGKAKITLGSSQQYSVSVVSASHHPIPGIKVSFSCTGPIECPVAVTTKTTTVPVNLTPTALGAASIKATASAPAGDGKLLKLATWRTHSGSKAGNYGVQRGWIAQRNTTAAAAAVEAQIVKGTPTVITRTSVATAAPGTALRDQVTVTGLPTGSHQQFTASLFGPFPARPTATSCTEEARTSQVTFTAGNGTASTPPITISEPGYYVWTESLPGDEVTNPVSTPCGILEETTLVQRPTPAPTTPRVRTMASTQRGLVGSQVYDTVLVDALPAGASVRVNWSLLGPIAPNHGSCAGLDWTDAPTLAHGTFKATHNGKYRTSSTRLRAPGCVTYVESLPATSTTAVVHTRPGDATETVLVTRRPVPVIPEIPSGPARAGR